MRRLTVQIHGDDNESRLLALPFDVYGPGGEPLGQGVVSPTEPTVVDLAPAADKMLRAHVVATRPDGEQLQASVRLQDGENTAILHVGTDSPHEWLQWVTPFRSLEHLTPRGLSAGAGASTRRRVGKVWVTVWELDLKRWRATDLRPQEQMSSDGARLLVLDVPGRPHLLQVGGDEVAWRLIALPPGGQARVALTRRAAESGDTIDVTVGRKRPVNDLIMSYLSSGAVIAADRLAEAWQAADLLLYMKMEDPVSAAAAAYVLLKMNRLEPRRTWVTNLVNWFSYLADGPIVAAALELQRPGGADVERARELIDTALERGVPLFAMGLSVLVETMAAVHRGKEETMWFQAQYQAARAFLQARASKGAYTSFYGRSPAEPSWTRLFGDSAAPVAGFSEHRLGPGRRPISSVGRIARSPERTLALTNRPKTTEDLLRLDLLRRQDSLREQDLWLRHEIIQSPLILPNLAELTPSNDLNAQRDSHAFEVFDGNE